MRTLFNDTTVVGGVSFFPFTPDFEAQIQRGLSLVCVMIIPICMSMALPVFIYQVVLEKETRLIENMKINGMKMANYWLVNFCFNFGFYALTVLLFLIFGIKVFKL